MKYLIFAAAMIASPALAHDFWTNGEAVPPWVKSACCGPRDVHRLNPAAVHVMADGYHIDGLKTVVPMGRVLPSPDGQVWAFFNESSGDEPVIFCFFYPISGS